MMASGQKNRRHGEQTPAPVSKSSRIQWFLGGGAVVVVAVAFFMLRPEPTPAPAASPSASAPAAPAKKTDHAGQERLVGRWLRPDGGYILEIRSVALDGKLDAGYFNPNPIYVARAEWQSKDSKLIIFVELRDVNYPGSTYTLEYLEAEDRMVGTYFQAVERVSFDVEFVRKK